MHVGKKKLTIAITFAIVVIGSAVTLGAIYYDELATVLSAKPTKDEDRGPVIVARAKTPLPSVPAAKKKAKTKKADKLLADAKTAAAKKAADTKPADPIIEPIEPADTKPADTKPADPIVEPIEPADTKPADKKAVDPIVEPIEPADPIIEPAPESENRCAELPFSYEFETDEPDAKHPFFKRFWGPNFGCVLAGAYDLSMPGPVQQVRARLNKMSGKQFERYKVRLEKIMRRYICRTFDYYLSTCKQVLDPAHGEYLTTEEVRVLLQRGASLYDVGATDRFRARRRSRRSRSKVSKVTEPPVSSAEPPTKVNKTPAPATRHIRVGLKTRRILTPRLCGNKLKPCPKP